MKRGLLLTILTITSMCLINSPIRGDTHVSEVTSEGRVGFNKGNNITKLSSVRFKAR
ncbi:hypothetical protein GCM10019815_00120 [Pediococcus damnosus]